MFYSISAVVKDTYLALFPSKHHPRDIHVIHRPPKRIQIFFEVIIEATQTHRSFLPANNIFASHKATPSPCSNLNTANIQTSNPHSPFSYHHHQRHKKNETQRNNLPHDPKNPPSPLLPPPRLSIPHMDAKPPTPNPNSIRTAIDRGGIRNAEKLARGRG